jgi:hypothetical protein
MAAYGMPVSPNSISQCAMDAATGCPFCCSNMIARNPNARRQGKRNEDDAPSRCGLRALLAHGVPREPVALESVATD